ncbi:right-handed parallel beta-helix repeat-containing protein [Methylomonas sp. MED-D]|uniref:right-handed parallel beta-helix repeat-containing protein n=1 Tax=Methylomonas sp. MED-D TaxID=3418768 RepID=UPI003CFF957B
MIGIDAKALAYCRWGLVLLLYAGSGDCATWQVGPSQELKLPSQAAIVAGNDDIVEIDAGLYPNDVATWPQHRLILRGVGGRAHLEAMGNNAEGKATWVIKGDDVTIESIEFSGARAKALNGAGIRFEGTNLTIRDSHFHDNQMGILTGANPSSEITIEGSEFNDNTVDYRLLGKLGHNIYIGGIKRFTLNHCYVHDANTGHNVKSRARENYLLYNRIGDETRASSYLVDFPDGGEAYLIGNQFRQSAASENRAMLSFAAEHNQTLPHQTLILINNTLVNDKPDGTFLNNHSIVRPILINNLLVGASLIGLESSDRQHNIVANSERFRNRGAFDYRLSAGASAIDQGIDPGVAANGFLLSPAYQYRHPARIEKRLGSGALDVGAYEFAPSDQLSPRGHTHPHAREQSSPVPSR